MFQSTEVRASTAAAPRHRFHPALLLKTKRTCNAMMRIAEMGMELTKRSSKVRKRKKS